jgi:hypothetical protein
MCVHVFLREVYLGFNRVRNPIGKALQYSQRYLIGYRLTCQLIGIVQVKVRGVIVKIWVEIRELGKVPIVVDRLEAEHEANDKRKRRRLGDKREKVAC